MEIRQRKYFLAVADRMHFTKAADFLHVSQAALSQQIRMLEEEIGVKLAETAVCLVAGNLGIALMSQSFRRLKVLGVVYRPLKHVTPSIEMYAIRRKPCESPLVDNFWRFVDASVQAPK